MARLFTLLAIGIPLLIAAGCAAPAKTVNMIPKDISIETKHPYSLSTEVMGGEETSELGASKISDEAFKAALEDAVMESGVFSRVVDIDGSDYHLQVVITNLGQPMAAFNMTVTLVTHWKLEERSTSKCVWQDFVATKYKASMDDAVIGTTRLRIANEGAARMNIEEGIRKLSALSLD